MISQLRYPKKVIQKESEDKVSWENLDNAKIDDWEKVASCNLKSHQKPAKLVFSDFDFNIPKDAVVTQIIIEHDFFKEKRVDLISIEPPTIKIDDFDKKSNIYASTYPVDREVIFSKGEVNLSVENIGSDGFNIELEFFENMSENSGEFYLNYLRVKAVYDFPKYIISSGETKSSFPNKNQPLQKAVGDDFEYHIFFRNNNGLKTDKQDVEILIPDGFKIEKFKFIKHEVNKVNSNIVETAKDEFDKKNKIWNPSVRGKGLSGIFLMLRCVSEGKYTLKAHNKFSGYTHDFHVDVHPNGTALPVNKFEESQSSVFEEDEKIDSEEKETVIKAENISLEFDMPQEKIDNIKEYFIRWIKRDIKPKKHFKALNNVSFEIKKGERVGVIGFNGAGKSTLLKVLAGVYTPTEGHAEINGKVAPLLELGAGFDHNYSGRENVFLNGSILGYSREFLESKYEEILEFSELGDFMEIPIKNYSSGMNAKLGFSIATVVDPEILILDEVLSVGDVKFQKKSGDKIKSMMDSGTTVLLVSHSTGKIRELCTRAIWLDHGKLVMDGDVDYVCNAYIEAAKSASADEVRDLEIV